MERVEEVGMRSKIRKYEGTIRYKIHYIPTDSCKFSTDEIIDAVLTILLLNFFVFVPNFAFVDYNFLSKRKFSLNFRIDPPFY